MLMQTGCSACSGGQGSGSLPTAALAAQAAALSAARALRDRHRGLCLAGQAGLCAPHGRRGGPGRHAHAPWAAAPCGVQARLPRQGLPVQASLDICPGCGRTSAGPQGGVACLQPGFRQRGCQCRALRMQADLEPPAGFTSWPRSQATPLQTRTSTGPSRPHPEGVRWLPPAQLRRRPACSFLLSAAAAQRRPPQPPLPSGWAACRVSLTEPGPPMSGKSLDNGARWHPGAELVRLQRRFVDQGAMLEVCTRPQQSWMFVSRGGVSHAAPGQANAGLPSTEAHQGWLRRGRPGCMLPLASGASQLLSAVVPNTLRPLHRSLPISSGVRSSGARSTWQRLTRCAACRSRSR